MNQSQREWAKRLKRPVPQLPVGYTQLELFKETQMETTQEGLDLQAYTERLVMGVTPPESNQMPAEFRLAHMVIDALESFLLTRQALLSLDSRGMGYVRSLLSGNFMYFVADAQRYLGENTFNRIVEEVERDAA